MPLTYTWATGYYARIDASVAGERIRWLRDTKGRVITAEEFLDDATPEDAPTHPAFEWDNAVAGHQYRLEQAREVLRCVIEITAKEADDLPHQQRMLIHVKPIPTNGHRGDVPHTSGYMLAEEARQIPEVREQVVERGLKELRSWVAKYDAYPELRPLMRAIRPYLSSGVLAPRASARPRRG